MKYPKTYRFTPPNCKFNNILIHNNIIFILICDFSPSILNDNEIVRIKSDGLFGRLPHLQKLEMKRNLISSIEANAFEGAIKLFEL